MIQRSPFPVTLLFPPQGHFTQPYLALPCLAAWLRAHGFDDVDLVDASVESYDDWLSRPWLERAAATARERLPLERFAGRERLDFADLEGFHAAAEVAASADALVEQVEEAKRVLRTADAFDPDRYVPAVRTLYQGLRLVSAAHFPTRWTPHNFTMRYANDRSREVLAATTDPVENPFVAWYREVLLPRIVARRPRVLGLSIIYGSQLIPALTLGRMVKAALPDCHVTAGGGFLAYIGEKLMHAAGVEDCLDSMVYHEGEGPLLALCEALRGGRGPDDVGSLQWFDRSGEGVRTVRNAPAHPVQLDAAPPPDFDGLPFDRYFSPEVVIPYDVNRGCYYGECTFCTLPTVIGPGYRTRSAGTIVDHVLHLKERHGTRRFNFVTDCMPPGMIRDLPDELLRRGADITWWSDARVEPKAYDAEGARKLHDSGCRKLLFGFETATPRLLKLMAKGQSPRSTARVAEACARAGISVTWYAMVGFPSETREEARATLDFLVENAGAVREVSLQTFHIDEVALTYRDPERFGLKILDDPEADLQLYHDYESESGMTQTEAAEAFEELMAGLREHLPIFSGDNLFYFMQKSHYFLHLARGTSPEEFVERCRARTERRERAAATDELAVRPGLRLVELPFSYTAASTTLAHPLARAIRPDFLTGRYVAGAREAAERELGSLEPRARVLAYAPGGHAEFAELGPDGARVLRALGRAGTLGALLADHADASESARERLREFAARLHRLGLLAPVGAAEPVHA